MRTYDFESLVEGSEESQTLEYKERCTWNIKTFAKDILAMSNVQDGGFIVIGFEDETLKRQGVSKKDLGTYNLEQMRDQMAFYADPFVSFTLYKPTGRDGKKYIVIRVFEFAEIPVVSRHDKYDIKEGVIYYRTRRKRPASEPINNSYDIRDVLDRAVVKLSAKRETQGYTVRLDETNKEYYEKELGGL